MSNSAMNIDGLLQAHFELAVSLKLECRDELALHVALAALRHQPPASGDDLIRFLVWAILHPAVTNSAEGSVARSLIAFPTARREALHWTQSLRNELAQEGEVSDACLLDSVASFIESLPPAVSKVSLPSLPPGCVNGIVVLRSGKACLTRVHVRLSERSCWDQGFLIGTPVPGANEAMSAAATYLRQAGCPPIDGMQAAVIVEGLFSPIEGRSLSLAVFMATISARTNTALPGKWAFTGSPARVAMAPATSSAVMPIDELRAKLSACREAGCELLIVPEHNLPADKDFGAPGNCRIHPTSTTAELSKLLPGHEFPVSPRIAGAVESLFVMIPRRHPYNSSDWPKNSVSGHPIFVIVTSLLFATLVTERWLLGDYLVKEYYTGVHRAGPWLATVLGSLAAALVGGGVFLALRLPRSLLRRGAAVRWTTVAVMLLGVYIATWVLVQPMIRNPLAPPPHGRFFEHRTLQWWKDSGVLFLYTMIFFVGPYARLIAAEGARQSGRSVWARDILRGERWACLAPSVCQPFALTVIASIAIMGLGYLDWISLTDGTRAGADAPWRTIHIVGRAQLLVISCLALLWWYARHWHFVPPQPSVPSRKSKRVGKSEQ
ncbi:MAG: hypothetical protein R6U98_27120 [Pirellulaceae bacterium]